MKKIFTMAMMAACMMVGSASADLIISGVIDGPLSGGTPKAVELFVVNNIADLSTFGVGSANNGDGTDGEEFTLSGSATAGDFIYIAAESANFNSYLGFAPTFTTGALLVNGDDAIELFSGGTVIDVFGNINVDGNGEAWEYLDGWAYRVDETGPDGSLFSVNNFTYSGANALDGETSNSTATSAFPVGTFTPPAAAVVPEPSSLALLGLIGMAGLVRRRK